MNRIQTVAVFTLRTLDSHPRGYRAALAKEGIEVSRVLVSTVKNKLNKPSTHKRAAKKMPVAEAAAPAVVEKPTTNGGAITLDQVKKVAHTIKTIGGFQRVTEVLEVIKELGGVKKFKDLAEGPQHGRHSVLIYWKADNEMAASTCVNCGNTSFELKETVLTGSPWKLYFVQAEGRAGVEQREEAGAAMTRNCRLSDTLVASTVADREDERLHAIHH